MKPLKKKQHYIWKNYLKPWTVRGQICCKRLDSKFKSSLERIGQQRFFYESEPLTEFEYNYLKYFIHKIFPKNNVNLYTILELYNTTANSKNMYEKKCGIEDVHTIIEGNAIKILEKIYCEDLSFFDNLQEKESFSLFVGIQYTRTNKMRMNLKNINLVTPNLNMDKLSKIFYLFFGDVVRQWILGQSKICLFINSSDLNLITGDQPIINIKANPNENSPVKEFELYYPISPKYAIFLSNRLEGKMEITKEQVIEYNRLIKDHSIEQLYAKTMNCFDNLKD